MPFIAANFTSWATWRLQLAWDAMDMTRIKAMGSSFTSPDEIGDLALLDVPGWCANDTDRCKIPLSCISSIVGTPHAVDLAHLSALKPRRSAHESWRAHNAMMPPQGSDLGAP